MLDELSQVLLANAAALNDVEEDETQFVVRRDVGVNQKGHSIAHVVFDTFTFGVSAQSQVLQNETADTG